MKVYLFDGLAGKVDFSVGVGG